MPLLSAVLVDCELTDAVGPAVPAEESDRRLAKDPDDPDNARSEDADGTPGLADGARRPATKLWRLARALLDVDELLDHLPRGGRHVRLVA